MEKFKKQLRRRTIFAGIYFFIVILLNTLANVFKHENSATSFTLGFSVGIGVLMIYFIIKYQKALRNEDKLRQLYVEESDERQKFINAKIGGVGINLSIMFLALAMLIANYFNQTVFFTLLAAMIFIAFIKFILKLYYNKKI